MTKTKTSSSPTTTPQQQSKKKEENPSNKIQKENHHSSSSSSFEYEFGGPIGTFLTIVCLPIIILLFTYFAKHGGIVHISIMSSSSWSSSSSLSISTILLEFFQQVTPRFFFKPSPSSPPSSSLEFDINTFSICMLGTLSWFLFQVFLERILPCESVLGTPIYDPNKKKKEEPIRLLYRINGHLAFWVTLLFLFFGYPYWITIPIPSSSTSSSSSSSTSTSTSISVLQFGQAPLFYLYDYYTEISFCVIVWCFLLSFYLYISSFLPSSSSLQQENNNGTSKILASGGNSGNIIYDFFMGRELNPRFRQTTFDWKEFCELRPGLIGWVVLNSSFVLVQRTKLGYVSWSMILVNIFQFLYVWDALYQESAILTTMDITTDGFGFMLIFGDLAWVPFMYSLQACYLVDHDPNLSTTMLGCIVWIHLLGYYIFRQANSQKDIFRKNPNSKQVQHLTYLETKRGTRLLTSGWWGRARKINYTGDWIMGLSWCLLCGYSSIVPYFYAVYFLILLIHRSERDDHLCKMKYGEDWEKYKKIVPYRFIPGVV